VTTQSKNSCKPSVTTGMRVPIACGLAVEAEQHTVEPATHLARAQVERHAHGDEREGHRVEQAGVHAAHEGARAAGGQHEAACTQTQLQQPA
jgi:hypothetical protein